MIFAPPPVPIAPLPDPGLAEYLVPEQTTPPAPTADAGLDDGQSA
ncbi:hypothetical protein ACFW2Y_16720 [Streptomyces sp. NPDC058877]